MRALRPGSRPVERAVAKPIGTFYEPVQELAHGVLAAREVLILVDDHGREVAALMPAAEYRRLQTYTLGGRRPPRS